MTTEQELKDQCTPEIIKRMVELAEGFFYKEKEVPEADDCIWFGEEECPIDLLFTEPLIFSTLIHRAVEGWNNDETVLPVIEIYPYKVYNKINYKFSNYQPQSLTPAECACLHCLLDIFEGERNEQSKR